MCEFQKEWEKMGPKRYRSILPRLMDGAVPEALNSWEDRKRFVAFLKASAAQLDTALAGPRAKGRRNPRQQKADVFLPLLDWPSRVNFGEVLSLAPLYLRTGLRECAVHRGFTEDPTLALLLDAWDTVFYTGMAACGDLEAWHLALVRLLQRETTHYVLFKITLVMIVSLPGANWLINAKKGRKSELIGYFYFLLPSLQQGVCTIVHSFIC